MTATTTLTVRISGPLAEFVQERVGDHGLYENISEYIRDLIRRDKERADDAEMDAFHAHPAVRAELTKAFAAPDEDFVPLDEAIAMIRRQSGRA